MSKKQTRRAAREAFPKAKVPATTRPSGGKYGSRAARQKARTQTQTRQGLRPPSWKRAAVFAFILAVAYFALLYFFRRGGGMNFWGALLFAFIGFVIFIFVVYYTDRFTYQRRLKKLKGSGK